MIHHDFLALVFYGWFGSSSIFNDNKKWKEICLCFIELSRYYEMNKIENKRFFGYPGFNYFKLRRKSLKLSVIIEEISQCTFRTISLEYHFTETIFFGLNLFIAVLTFSSLNMPGPKASLIHIVSNLFNSTRNNRSRFDVVHSKISLNALANFSSEVASCWFSTNVEALSEFKLF